MRDDLELLSDWAVRADEARHLAGHAYCWQCPHPMRLIAGGRWLRTQIILHPLARGKDGAGSLTAEESAQEEAIAADPLVEDFRDLDDTGNPEEKRDRNQQWQAHSDKTDAACAAMDAAVFGDAVNRFLQIVPRKMRGEAGGRFV